MGHRRAVQWRGIGTALIHIRTQPMSLTVTIHLDVQEAMVAHGVRPRVANNPIGGGRRPVPPNNGDLVSAGVDTAISWTITMHCPTERVNVGGGWAMTIKEPRVARVMGLGFVAIDVRHDERVLQRRREIFWSKEALDAPLHALARAWCIVHLHEASLAQRMNSALPAFIAGIEGAETRVVVRNGVLLVLLRATLVKVLQGTAGVVTAPHPVPAHATRALERPIALGIDAILLNPVGYALVAGVTAVGEVGHGERWNGGGLCIGEWVQVQPGPRLNDCHLRGVEACPTTLDLDGRAISFFTPIPRRRDIRRPFLGVPRHAADKSHENEAER